MIFFLGGYLTSLYLLTSGKKEILILLTGLVFLFGAFFVYIVVRVSCRTIDSLLTKDRTEELNLKLRDNIRELEFANKQLESFSYSVSHDLRAPLRSVRGFSKIIGQKYEKVLGAEGNELMGIVQQGAKKMEDLIEELLAFSKLGNQDMQKILVDMTKSAKSVWEEVQKLQPGIKAEIKIDDLLMSKADQALINQVWINLISNAIKYSGKKEKPLIEIGSFSREYENIYFVKDNGAGFDMKYSDKLFKVFQRLHTTAEFEGTGIGLAIVERIIERHEGKVWAFGKENEGATFYFSLPKEDL